MQVWQLMAELSKYEAGWEVYVSDGPDGWVNDIGTVNQDEDSVFIRGDGIATAENEDS